MYKKKYKCSTKKRKQW